MANVVGGMGRPTREVVKSNTHTVYASNHIDKKISFNITVPSIIHTYKEFLNAHTQIHGQNNNHWN